MNKADLEHFERTNSVHHNEAVDFLHTEMPIEELVDWLLELMPAHLWSEFLVQFQLEDPEQTYLPLETAMKGWKVNE